MGELNDKKAMNNQCELQNNKSVNNYGCLLKRMLYCPGSGQELLSALGVTLYAMLPMFFWFQKCLCQ